MRVLLLGGLELVMHNNVGVQSEGAVEKYLISGVVAAFPPTHCAYCVLAQDVLTSINIVVDRCVHRTKGACPQFRISTIPTPT